MSFLAKLAQEVMSRHVTRGEAPFGAGMTVGAGVVCQPALDGCSGVSGGSGGEGAAAECASPATWPAAADWHLTRTAVRLAAMVEAGCDWRWCPAGGLDVAQPDGRLWCLAPATVGRLREAGLLPQQVEGAAHPPAPREA